MPDNCNSQSLQPYVPTADQPWDKKRVLHLYRRLGYGATFAEIDNALTDQPSQHIDEIIDTIVASPLSEPLEWADWTVLDYVIDGEFDGDLYIGHLIQWLFRITQNRINHQFRAKLVQFWAGHFVTQLGVYQNVQPFYKYHRVLEEFALGNFKTFTEEIGKTPAMLLYLNGADSTNADANENYARELFELFTLGQDNGYTQSDIENTARALTGWTVLLESNTEFNENLWDNTEKTIFGQTGNWGYSDVHNILFEQKSLLIAQHICREIYRFYVAEQINEDIVNQLAQTFLNNNFELAPVFRQLFKSEHFFSEDVISIQIKSPTEIIMSVVREFEFDIDLDGFNFIYGATELMGQRMFDPPDVSGWDGYHSWINATNIILRWDVSYLLLGYNIETNSAKLIGFAKTLTDNSNDPDFITRRIVDHFMLKGLLTEVDYQTAIDTFKGEVPQNYFDDGSWNLDWEFANVQILNLFVHLSTLPAYQLT